MRIEKLSKKQKLLFKWAFVSSNSNKYKAVICDGAVRTGKSICMSMAFIMWAMKYFNGAVFGICGKTIKSVVRNIFLPLQNQSDITNFYTIEYTSSDNKMTISVGKIKNHFYFFGGKDEGSYALIQGVTLSGIMFDEVALMPKSFVEQALARTLSVENSKLWFNCNPENPNHYFYKEWIEKAEEKRALYIHFSMEDNPILTKEAIESAKALYEGVFYDRYILGKWTAPNGLIYTMFDKEKHVVKKAPNHCKTYVVSCDYGTVNPTSMGLWGENDGKWYRIREYYFDSKKEGYNKTDVEYYDDLMNLVGSEDVSKVIIDPSAASFIEYIRKKGRFKVEKASNRVLDGIREVSSHLQKGDLLFCECCLDSIREFSLYVWDESSSDDKPLKINDHAMDEIRYFVKSVFSEGLMEF